MHINDALMIVSYTLGVNAVFLIGLAVFEIRRLNGNLDA